MKTKLLTLLSLLTLLYGAGIAQDDKKAKDDEKKTLEKLEGAWLVTSLEYDGKDLTDKIKLRLVFKGKQITVEGNDAVKKEYAKLNVKLDPATTPPILDLSVADGTMKDTTFDGIFELKDKQLKMCVKVGANERPANFTAEAGSNNALVILKKEAN